MTIPTAGLIQHSIGRRLVPVADRLRDIRVRFGLRPYLIRMIRTKWSGGARGAGVETVTDVHEILPVPKLISLDSLQEIASVVGADEVGSVILSEISGRYTEEILKGQNPDGAPLATDERLYYEVEFIKPDGTPGDKRRFNLKGIPTYEAEKMQWVIRLDKARDGRDRQGNPR